MYDSNEPVPMEQRRSVLGLSLVLAGVPFCVSGLLVGGALSKGLPLSQGIEAALLGGLVLTLYAGFIGAIGARTSSRGRWRAARRPPWAGPHPEWELPRGSRRSSAR